MCLNTGEIWIIVFFVLSLAAALIIAGILSRKNSANIKTNLVNFSKLLKSPEFKDFFGFWRLIADYEGIQQLSGYYKDRKVVVHSSTRIGGGQAWIEPKSAPKLKKFYFLYPKPTWHTFFTGKRIVLTLNPLFCFSIYREEKIRKILDELTEAAEKVEAECATPKS